jgi:prepilin-type N-terminal cleavage/methylation domain-containing protein
VKARLRARLRSERGYSLVELVIVMSILGTIMAGITGLMVSGTKAELEMNERFQAQTEARLALDYLRRETHCASSVSPAGPATTVTLTMPVGCPTSGVNTQVTWCTVANGPNRYGLWRFPGTNVCSGTGRRIADHLTNPTAFSYTAPATGTLAKLGLTIWVNLKPAEAQSTYKLSDEIVLRNSVRG